MYNFYIDNVDVIKTITEAPQNEQIETFDIVSECTLSVQISEHDTNGDSMEELANQTHIMRTILGWDEGWFGTKQSIVEWLQQNKLDTTIVSQFSHFLSSDMIKVWIDFGIPTLLHKDEGIITCVITLSIPTQWKETKGITQKIHTLLKEIDSNDNMEINYTNIY